jgi:SAM-dependent methyltransferase
MEKNPTVDTYNESARALSEYFNGIGPRIEDIERGLSLAGASENASVVEIGCGDGRDAEEILKRVGSYEGFDPSEGLLNIAQEKVPDGKFVQADHLTYTYPEDLDVVYAFASLLHINKEDFQGVLKKVKQALKKDGVFYMSLKERDQYMEEVKNDEFGERVFYFYNVDVIRDLMGEDFDVAYEDHQTKGNTKWFTLALRNNG